MTNTPTQVFVTGTQRSGTTLLFRILLAEGSLFCQNEIDDVSKLIFDPLTMSSNRRRTQLINRINEIFHVNAGAQEFAAPVDYFRASLLECLKQSNATGWCIKDPRITYHLDDYATHFPNAKFIILVRDPRAVCRSYLDRTTFTLGRPTNLIAAAERWSIEAKKQVEFAERHPNRTLFVHYENLITNLGETVREVANFAGLCNQKAMMTYYLRANAGTEVHAGNCNILSPPLKDCIHKWKSTFSSEETAVIESISQKEMASTGYLPSQPTMIPSLTKRIVSRLKDRFCRELLWQLSKLKSR